MGRGSTRFMARSTKQEAAEGREGGRKEGSWNGNDVMASQ